MSVGHLVGKFGKPPANRHIHKSQFHFFPNLYQTQYNKYGSVLHFDNMFLIRVFFFFFSVLQLSLNSSQSSISLNSYNFTNMERDLYIRKLTSWGARIVQHRAHQFCIQIVAVPLSLSKTSVSPSVKCTLLKTK